MGRGYWQKRQSFCRGTPRGTPLHFKPLHESKAILLFYLVLLWFPGGYNLGTKSNVYVILTGREPGEMQYMPNSPDALSNTDPTQHLRPVLSR
jgi:hypothetical protein